MGEEVNYGVFRPAGKKSSSPGASESNRGLRPKDKKTGQPMYYVANHGSRRVGERDISKKGCLPTALLVAGSVARMFVSNALDAVGSDVAQPAEAQQPPSLGEDLNEGPGYYIDISNVVEIEDSAAGMTGNYPI